MNKEYAQRCENLFRGLYQVYEWIKNGEPLPDSNTSRLLHDPDKDLFTKKIEEELGELVDLSAGNHSHTGNPKRDFLMEGHQVWYWLTMLGVTEDLDYDNLRTHEHLLSGFRNDCDMLQRKRPEIVTGTIPEIILTNKTCMEFVGYKCNQFDAYPHEIGVYDLEQMKRRPYLMEPLLEFGLIESEQENKE